MSSDYDVLLGLDTVEALGVLDGARMPYRVVTALPPGGADAHGRMRVIRVRLVDGVVEVVSTPEMKAE